MGKIVEVQNLSFTYTGVPVLSNFDFHLMTGNIYTLIGPTGSGKSTLARILIGLEYTHDYIKIDGKFLNPKNLEYIRNSVKLITENPKPSFVTNTVMKELEFELKCINEKDISARVNELVKNYHCEHLLNKKISDLSGGESQIVALLAALISKPKLLILDEALTLVDRNTKDKLFVMLQKEVKEGLTILQITQNPEDLLYGSEVCLLDEGKIVFQEKVKKSLQLEHDFTEHHLSLPFVADLSNKLQYYEKVSTIHMNDKKLVDELWK